MKKRNVNLDLIRAVAIFSVVAVHFFLNVGYYNERIAGKSMLLMTYLRTLFMICVPLFLMLTGFLMTERKFDKKHLRTLFKIITIYIISCIFCLLFKVYVLKEGLSFLECVGLIFNYKASTYGWYINMYIGLFLLAPFINIVYKRLEHKKDKQILILILLFLTAGPSLFNFWNVTNFEAGNIFSSHQLVPDFWISIYPISYYLIGSYIKEYKIKINPLFGLFLTSLFLLLFGGISIIRNYNSTFINSDMYNSYQSIGCVVLSILVFITLLNINLKNTSSGFKNLLKKISTLSLGAYLLSPIFDSIFYKVLNNSYSTMDEKIVWFLPITLWVLISSLVLSQLVEYLKELVDIACTLIFKNRCKKNKKMI